MSAIALPVHCQPPQAQLLSAVGRAKRVETKQQLKDLAPKLEVTVASVKELQRAVEADLSSKYKGRKVNLLGDINTI